MLRYRVHYATKVFAVRTIHNKSFDAAIVVVSNLVALVALIVSYPILLLTNNNMMMISVRRMFKKWQMKKLFVASSAATKTGENAEGHRGQKAKATYTRARPTFF